MYPKKTSIYVTRNLLHLQNCKEDYGHKECLEVRGPHPQVNTKVQSGLKPKSKSCVNSIKLDITLYNTGYYLIAASPFRLIRLYKRKNVINPTTILFSGEVFQEEDSHSLNIFKKLRGHFLVMVDLCFENLVLEKHHRKIKFIH